ncbi:MAG: metallophosphoesterase family protein [Verrucomicrobiae bacterium]|nr:metallophosphoesterase family protein [Verrucomicrobiae bacterium]
MKLGILGDIHGNLEALQTVLADAKEEGINQFVSVGDLVGYGPNPKECLEVIRDELKCPCVKGNHDELASQDVSTMSFNPIAAEAITWTRNQLDEDHKKYLRGLPMRRLLGDYELVHATLDMPKSWGYVFDRLAAASSMNYQNTPVCFFGHTHVPMVFVKEGLTRESPVRLERNWSSLELKPGWRYFINVGSIGQPRDGNPKCAYVIFDMEKQVVTIKRLDYDIAAVQYKIRQAGLPEKLATRLEHGK